MVEIRFRSDRVFVDYNGDNDEEESVVVKLVKEFQKDENIVEVVLTVK